MASNASDETAFDLAARLRDWVAENDHASAALGDLLTRAAAALDQSARGEPILDDELRNRHTYKEVLAHRGERQRPDGTPLWPLRPDDFPGSYKDPSPATRAAPANGRDDLPDWMR